ncbi:hypothetical protein [Methylobacterium flocculans]|uniref:hypothetical protein n=1 Tax=Methylobacterium flocculans TaxID=2984843 RepID=UPI0021F2C2CC|nr:hypothetical protein [Methylobacterium sp. FF17]
MADHPAVIRLPRCRRFGGRAPEFTDDSGWKRYETGLPSACIPPRPLAKNPMLVLALVVAGNILLASLFSLIAVAAD